MRLARAISVSGIGILLLLITLAPLCTASEQPVFFSSPGKYLLQPGLVLLISEEGENRLPKLTLQFSRAAGWNHTLEVEHQGDPYLVYWDAGTQMLWWGTPQSVGYIDVKEPDSFASDIHRRTERFHDYEHFPPRPPEFVAELERRMPMKR